MSEARYLDFEHVPDDEVSPDGKPILNRYSRHLTKDHDYPGAQVRLILTRCVFPNVSTD